MAAMEVRDVSGRGRGVVALRDLRAGEVVLQESPFLVYAESEATAGFFCAHCHRCIISPSSSPVCARCVGTRFCSEECRNSASKLSHSPWICESLSDLVQVRLETERENQGRFLIAAAELAMREPNAFQRLLMLDGSASGDDTGIVGIVDGILRRRNPEFGKLKWFSLELMLGLLGKDKNNAFGLMAPTSQDGQRRVRAYALYSQASMFNHDCLPNACRFDYLDKPGTNNVDIYIRVLHDVKAGTEICISYFPVNWTYAERQERLLEDYGFSCRCERCIVEESWSDAEAMDQDGSDEEEEFEENDKDDFPHAMFFVKYLCPVEGCGGTMAPLAENPITMECNVCGRLRTEAEFEQDLQQNNMA